MFRLKCQTLGIIQCKDTIPDLQELTVNREADPNIAMVIAKTAIHRGH